MSIHDFGYPHTYSDVIEEPRAEIRKRIEDDTKRFMEAGGSIVKVKYGESGYGFEEVPAEVLLRMPMWKRMAFYQKRRWLGALEEFMQESDEHIARTEAEASENELAREVGAAKIDTGE